MQDRHGDTTIEVTALDHDIRDNVGDLEVAFGTRDWALVARIYRAVAGLADRLEALDPAARSRTLERLEREQQARDETYAEDADPLLDDLGLDDEPPGDGDPTTSGAGYPAPPADSDRGADPFSPWRPR